MTYHDDPIIRDLEFMTDARNYNTWIFSRLKDHVGRRVVEVGAGIGNFSTFLLERELVIALDSYAACVEYMKRRFAEHANVLPMNLSITDPDAIRLREHRPDTVVCVNVLEHVEDDELALAHMHRILEPGGGLALLVPAFPFLKGSIDDLVGHHRRYTRNEVRNKLTRAGFSILDIFFMNAPGLVGWFLNNRILRRREESPSQVAFFDRFIVPWLSVAEGIVRPPFGLSLIALARKQGG